MAAGHHRIDAAGARDFSHVDGNRDERLQPDTHLDARGVRSTRWSERIRTRCRTSSRAERRRRSKPSARPHGRLLSFVPTGALHMLVRPARSNHLDHAHAVGGRRVRSRRQCRREPSSGKSEKARFRAERAPSVTDGAPALVLSYPKTPRIRSEVRMIDDGIAVGLTFVSVAKKEIPVVWFGLAR